MLTFPQSHHERDQDCTDEDLIRHNCEPQEIEEYQCDFCQGKRLAMKCTVITMCPPILCIVLCRRKQDGDFIKSAVKYPLRGLNIADDDLQYNLVGTVHHKPNGKNHGHYMSICQSQRLQSRIWFNYDDNFVSQSKFYNKQNENVLKLHTRLATILFYINDAVRNRNRDITVEIEDDATSSSSSENVKDSKREAGGSDVSIEESVTK
jgi:hypothetical protein